MAKAPHPDVLTTARLIMNGKPHELRTVVPQPKAIVSSGVFATAEELARAAEKFDGYSHCYIGLNPTSVDPYPVRRGEAVSDAQIARVRWLGVDIDGDDPDSVYGCLKFEYGFPEPVLAFSGRGWWLLWRIDQANTLENAELRRRFLSALKERFPDVDVSVFNASRVARLFGTMNVKENAQRSGLVNVPDPLQVVPDELLEAVAGTLAPRAAADAGIAAPLAAVERKLTERGILVTRERRLAAGVARQLSDCPFYPNDTHRAAAALFVWDDGNIGFRCQGGRCTAADNRILELLHLLDLRLTRHTTAGGLHVIVAADVRPERVELAWGGRIVLHDLNAVVGDEKIGKGLTLVRLTAEITTGRLTGRPEFVLYASAEEQVARFQRPRLEAAGADLSRVLLVPMGGLGLPEAIPELVEAMNAYGARWLLLDGINRHFSAGFHPDNKRDVALVLGELAKMAAEHRVTVIGSLHTNRGGDVSARGRYAHSLEFRRALRSAVIIGRTEDDGEDERTLVHDFSNYARTAPSLKASIQAVAIQTDDGVDEVPVLTFGSETDATAEELFLKQADREAAIAEARAAKGQKAQCEANIRGHWERLGRPGEVPATAFDAVTKQFNAKTIQRARRALGIEAVGGDRDPVTGGILRWFWRFPETLP